MLLFDALKKKKKEVTNDDALGNQSLACTVDTFAEVATTVRNVPPVHYTLRIKSFSLLSKALQERGVDMYESSDFEAGGYKWRLVLYPNGNPKRDANDHISLSLAISKTNKLPPSWEVHAFFKFLVFDKIRDKYLVVQDVGERRFHAMKTEWGIPRLLTLSTFNDPALGYLIDDCCVFGVDVFVIKCEGKGAGESLSMIKEPKNGTFTWKLHNFSKLKEESYPSEGFTVGGCRWKLQLLPKGDSRVKGKGQLSLYLYLVDGSVHRPGWKVYVEYMLRIKDQVHDKHYELKCDDRSFCESGTGWGWPEFIALSDLNDVKKGFLLKDTLIVEVKITLISKVNYFAPKKRDLLS